MAYWKVEIPILVRTLINDLSAQPMYTDDRLIQCIVVASNYVKKEANLTVDYIIDAINETISPDPCLPSNKDEIFLTLLALKAACILDQSTYRTKAIEEGIRTSLGSASLSVSGNLAGYKTLLEVGPCKMYEQLLIDHNIGNGDAVRAILSPFIGNNFDPQSIARAYVRDGYGSTFFS